MDDSRMSGEVSQYSTKFPDIEDSTLVKSAGKTET